MPKAYPVASGWSQTADVTQLEDLLQIDIVCLLGIIPRITPTQEIAQVMLCNRGMQKLGSPVVDKCCSSRVIVHEFLTRCLVAKQENLFSPQQRVLFVYPLMFVYSS